MSLMCSRFIWLFSHRREDIRWRTRRGNWRAVQRAGYIFELLPARVDLLRPVLPRLQSPRLHLEAQLRAFSERREKPRKNSTPLGVLLSGLYVRTRGESSGEPPARPLSIAYHVEILNADFANPSFRIGGLLKNAASDDSRDSNTRFAPFFAGGGDNEILFTSNVNFARFHNYICNVGVFHSRAMQVTNQRQLRSLHLRLSLIHI